MARPYVSENCIFIWCLQLHRDSKEQRRCLGCVQVKKTCVLKAYTRNESADDLLCISHVDMELKNGSKLSQEFISRFWVASAQGASPKLQSYSIWAVCNFSLSLRLILFCLTNICRTSAQWLPFCSLSEASPRRFKNRSREQQTDWKIKSRCECRVFVIT
jgi:hypothetical protein